MTSPLLPKWKRKIFCANLRSSGLKGNGWIWPARRESIYSWKRPLTESQRYPSTLTSIKKYASTTFCNSTLTQILVYRSTHLRCTSSRPKITMLETIGARSPTRTSLTAVLLTWKSKVCHNNKKLLQHRKKTAQPQIQRSINHVHMCWYCFTEAETGSQNIDIRSAFKRR